MRTAGSVVLTLALVAAPALAQEPSARTHREHVLGTPPMMMHAMQCPMVPGMMMHGHGGMGMGTGMMGMGMMMGMGGGMMGPAMILGLRETLDLTPAQVGQLEELQRRTQESMRAQMTEVMRAHEEAAQALAGDSPDLGRYEERLQAAARQAVAAHVAMARTGVQARQLLTAEQRGRLDVLREAMMEMHHHCMRAGMGPAAPGAGQGPPGPHH